MIIMVTTAIINTMGSHLQGLQFALILAISYYYYYYRLPIFYKILYLQFSENLRRGPQNRYCPEQICNSYLNFTSHPRASLQILYMCSIYYITDVFYKYIRMWVSIKKYIFTVVLLLLHGLMVSGIQKQNIPKRVQTCSSY